MHLPDRIRIREVSPRDGLQGEPVPVATADKIRLVDMLSAAGFARINVTSFVSPRAVPQMADAEQVMAGIERRPGVVYDASVPNPRGAQRALDAGVDALVVFVDASDAGNRRSVNRSREDAEQGAVTLIGDARERGFPVVATVATAFGCPYEGVIPEERVLAMADRFVAAGATGLALGDTTGEATPRHVARLVGTLLDRHPEVELGLHFHDTRGLALANVLAAMDVGATNFDSAVGGIGGNPFLDNASGNLATEDLVHMCEEMGVETGVDLDAVIETYRFVEETVQHRLPGKVGRVGRSKTPIAGPA